MNPTILSGKFSPLHVPNCVLWLEADRGITLDGSNYVSAWADQSGNGINFSQATAAKRFLYETNVINGCPGCKAEVAASLTGMSASVTGLDDLTGRSVVLVFDPDDASWNSQQALLGDNGRRLELQFQTDIFNVIIHSGTTYYYNKTGKYTASTPQLVTIVFDGNGATDADKLKLYVNGTQKV